MVPWREPSRSSMALVSGSSPIQPTLAETVELAPEVWIVNLAAEEVEVYRCPAADNDTSVTRAGLADMLAIEALPGVFIPVAGIFA